MRLRSKLNFIDAIVSKFIMTGLNSNLNNIVTSISVLSNNSKYAEKLLLNFQKHENGFTNMRLKTALIPNVGKTLGK